MAEEESFVDIEQEPEDTESVRNDIKSVLIEHGLPAEEAEKVLGPL